MLLAKAGWKEDMTEKSLKADAGNVADLDGRRLRSERSREDIIQALFNLVRGGTPVPSAAQVAEEANVSLRTVFRHFEEMDSLYAEMGKQVGAQIFPQIFQPYKSSDWRDRFHEAIDRYAIVYEDIMPLRISSRILRHQSEYLKSEHERVLDLEFSRIVTLLPKELRKDDELTYGLDVVMSFDVWRRLRIDRGLSVEEARDTVRRVVDSLIR